MDKKVTFEHLRTVLGDLGYRPHDVDDIHVVFRHPERRLYLIATKGVVRPIDLLSMQKSLANDGVVREEDFESLFFINKGERLIWTDPKTGRETRVVAAAGEKDGFVVIKHKGTLSPCPVNQLRKAPPQRAKRASLGVGDGTRHPVE